MNLFGCAVTLAASMLVVTAPAYAGGTAAGTKIDNIATATFDGLAGTQSVTSNLVSLRVDELLGVLVASADPGPVSARNGDVGSALRFQVTNAGNGPEAFVLDVLNTVGGDDFDPAASVVMLDTNGNSAYDPGIDTAYAAGVNEPVLAPDQSVSVFIVSNMPASAADAARGIARLTASTATGTGTPGTVFAGTGQGGGDAIVGATTGRASAEGVYVLASVSVSFVKSATVLDAFGGTRALPGSIVTYRLTAELTGSGSVSGLRLADTAPAGTTYQPGSLTSGGAVLTDAADADAGVVANGAVSVAVGTATAGSAQVVTFKVRID